MFLAFLFLNVLTFNGPDYVFWSTRGICVWFGKSEKSTELKFSTEFAFEKYLRVYRREVGSIGKYLVFLAQYLGSNFNSQLVYLRVSPMGDENQVVYL